MSYRARHASPLQDGWEKSAVAGHAGPTASGRARHQQNRVRETANAAPLGSAAARAGTTHRHPCRASTDQRSDTAPRGRTAARLRPDAARAIGFRPSHRCRTTARCRVPGRPSRSSMVPRECRTNRLPMSRSMPPKGQLVDTIQTARRRFPSPTHPRGDARDRPIVPGRPVRVHRGRRPADRS